MDRPLPEWSFVNIADCKTILTVNYSYIYLYLQLIQKHLVWQLQIHSIIIICTNLFNVSPHIPSWMLLIQSMSISVLRQKALWSRQNWLRTNCMFRNCQWDVSKTWAWFSHDNKLTCTLLSKIEVKFSGLQGWANKVAALTYEKYNCIHSLQYGKYLRYC